MRFQGGGGGGGGGGRGGRIVVRPELVSDKSEEEFGLEGKFEICPLLL